MEKRNIIIERSFNVTATEDGDFVFEISNEKVDSHGTVVKKSALGLDRYLKNPIVTLGHPDVNTSDIDLVIGTSEIFHEGTSTMARFLPEEGNPKADIAKRKIKNKTLNMASIRALMTDGRFGIEERGEDPDIFYFTEGELLDWGVMMHGSNPGATRKSISRAIEMFTEKEEDSRDESNLIENSIGAARLIINSLIKKLQ